MQKYKLINKCIFLLAYRTIPYLNKQNKIIRESDFNKEIKIIFAETKRDNNAEEKPNTHPTISYIFPINARKR